MYKAYRYKKKAHRQSLGWGKELKDLVKGACGGFLFGVPLLYTMEVWWIGSSAEPLTLVAAFITTFLVVYFLNRVAGFRNQNRRRRFEGFMDTVEAMAIGSVCTFLVLALLQEITLSTQLSEAVGKVIYESIPFSIGVALANQFLDDQSEGLTSSDAEKNSAALTDVAGTLVGALVIGFNIAPTDEVTMLASQGSEPVFIAMILVSLLISYGVVFVAGFSKQSQRLKQKGLFQHPSSETLVSYLISLIVAAFMLWLFQQVGFSDPWQTWLKQTLVLGLPTTIGGAAGRLAI
jgi:putative integral membrane protein (TIGR02587 family)